MSDKQKCERCGMTATQVYKDTHYCDWCKKGYEYVDRVRDRIHNP